MSKFSLGLLAAAAAFMCAVLPASGQRGGAAPIVLPDGPGKETVQTQCSRCHGLNMITGSWGYDKEGWNEVFSSMVLLPKEYADSAASYLATHFPEKGRPKTVVVPGDAKVTFKEWIAPTLGSRPHDPLAAADGTLWWAGMWGNVLGHVDPKTGAIKEYPLKTERSGPHGLTEDKAGNIWFTANTGGYVGKFDPKTGAITEYKMPDPAARDPHTPMFDRKGNLWFTLQQANKVGRLNPQTGEIKLVDMPQPRSNPYGMVIMSNGNPFICEFGANRLAMFDVDTMAITEYTLPNPETRPRRLPSTAPTTSGTGITRGVISAGSIRRPARPRNGRRQAVLCRSRTGSPPTRTSSGTTSPRSGRIRSCALTRRRRSSRAGSSRAAEAWSAT